MTLTEFLLARIATDEAMLGQLTNDEVDRDLVGGALFAWAPDPMPIVLNRARLLAECAAKRRIIALHRPGHECSQYDHNGDIDWCSYVHEFENCSTLRLLAEPYRWYPGFDASWLLEETT